MLRILIVEDEPMIGLHLEDLLTDGGHQVVGVAHSMKQALLIAGLTDDIDVAIMDINLSDKPDGIEAARRLKVGHGVTSLFVSSNLTERNVDRASVLDAVGFINKPFIEEQVLRALAPLNEDPPRLRRTTAEQLAHAFEDGRLAGSDLYQSASQCPWLPDGRRDLRHAWLAGFVQGRAVLRSEAR